MNYSLKNIFRQEPNAIREAILAILAVLVMTGVVHVDEKTVAGIGLCVSLVLGLLYVRPLSVNKDKLEQLNETSPETETPAAPPASETPALPLV